MEQIIFWSCDGEFELGFIDAETDLKTQVNALSINY